MNLQTLIVDSIREATGQVFTTMLDLEIQAGEHFIEKAPPGPTDGVVSFIGLAGQWAGTGSLTCPPALACKICSQMLLTEEVAVNEEVLDAVAELTNMIIGNVKTTLEEHLGPLGLSIPTVIFGRNFRTRTARNAEWSVVPFQCGDESLVVKLCLAPSEPSQQPGQPHQICAVDV